MVWFCGEEGWWVIQCAKVNPVRLRIKTQVCNSVTHWVIGVGVGVVRLRVDFFKGAHDVEGVVDHKCDVVFLEEVLGYSYH